MVKANERFDRRERRVRYALRVRGRDRVRLSVHRSGRHIYGQLIDDQQGRTLAAASTLEKELRSDKGRGWLMRWLPSRAHDNGLFLIFSNGIGVDDDEIRAGSAMVLDPYGRILVETSKAGDDMVITDLDGSLLADSTGRRWMRARRPDLYGPLTVPTGMECDTRKLKFEE